MGNYTIKETSNGKKTLIYKNEKEIRIHSAYDPEKETNRTVSQFDKGRCSYILITGLGLGYHLKALHEKYPETPQIIIEHDQEVVELTKKHFPDHIKDSIVITPETDYSTIFENIDMTGFIGVSHYVHKPSYGLYSEYYSMTLRDINQYISSKISDLLTRFEFEERWIKNIFSNLHHLTHSIPVKSLFGKFKGYPGIIISAGPSLRKNIDVLESIKEKALLVSVDTAIKVLEKKNIKPHIVMTLDAQKYSLKHFTGLSASSTVLLADLVSYPEVMRTYKGDKIISTTSKYYPDENGNLQRETTPVMDWIEQYIAPIGDIQSGGSVATSVFDLLLNLGCDPIILVGQDLAYTGREIHCSGSYHNDDWLPITTRFINLDTINQQVVRKRKIKYIESYGGKGTVVSDFVFDLYRGWFEDSAKKVPITVINATEGGGRIANTKEEDLKSLSKKLKVHKITPSEILLNEIKNCKTVDIQILKNSIEKTLKNIHSLEEDLNNIGENNAELIKDVIEIIETTDLKMIYNPLLRKTNMYIIRKNLDGAEIFTTLKRELTSATEKLSTFFKTTIETIDLISKSSNK